MHVCPVGLWPHLDSSHFCPFAEEYYSAYARRLTSTTFIQGRVQSLLETESHWTLQHPVGARPWMSLPRISTEAECRTIKAR